jgi:ferredoxin
MTLIRFLNPDGSLAAQATVPPGTRLLTLAQTLGLPLEGTCEGAMACSTCHVIVARADFAKLPEPTPHEEDMLDFTAHVQPTSRLGCQIHTTADLAELTVSLPVAHRDMRGR